MRKFFLFCLLLYNIHAYACDVCGCYMGIVPYDNQSGIAWYFRYRAFNGYGIYHQESNLFPSLNRTAHDPGNTTNNTVAKEYSSKDYELIFVNELRAKYFLHHRFEVNVILPFFGTTLMYNNQKTQISGIGDFSIYASYHFIHKTETEGIKQKLLAGAGIKFPTGNFEKRNAEGIRYSIHNQPGTGSTDLFFTINYMLAYKKWGLNFNETYKVNGTNLYKEKIGNSFTSYTSLFMRLSIGDQWHLMPGIQSYFEYSKGVLINEKLADVANAEVLMMGPVMNVFYKNIALQTSVEFAVYENSSDTELSSAGRVVVGLTYNFNQKKFLLEKKPKAAEPSE